MSSGFRNTTKMTKGFRFPANAGFSSSTGRVQNISYTRRTPQRKMAEGGQARLPSRPADKPLGGVLSELRKTLMPKATAPVRVEKALKDAGAARGGVIGRCYAEGGRVRDGALHGPIVSNALDQEAGPDHALRPGFKKGGKNFIKGAIKHPGAFTAKAKRAGKSVGAYASQVTKEGSHASTQTKRQANLAKTLRKMHKAKGGVVNSDAAEDRPMMERIAHKVVGEHVARAAPQGHKGLGNLLKGRK